MKNLFLPLLITCSFFTLSGCEQTDSLEAPKKFFSNNKSGDSADYGIFKGLGDEDHVVTVHGFMDDLEICLKLADKLNEQEPGAFRCRPLNH